ncbi:hypothetical protein [Roseibium sp. SCP14]|uniref:hypothetical protein n=1 Tax=Roseibium sp. SCP14 TaxID=3141375 RepID=UPI00333D9E15
MRHDFRLPATLKVFDIQAMTAFGGKVSFKSADTVTLGNQKISAHRYSLEAEGETVEVWMRTVGSGLPHFVQLTGKDGGTPFKIVLRPWRQ